MELDAPQSPDAKSAGVKPLLRAAVRADIPALALANVYGVDTALIDDGTYFALEDGVEIVACGGWSKRANRYGGDHFAGRSEGLLDPARDAAKIRAFFVHPGRIRRGLASALLERCETEAIAAGFRRVELGSTLSGVAFYLARGYVRVALADVPLPHAESLPIVRMERRLRSG